MELTANRGFACFMVRRVLKWAANHPDYEDAVQEVYAAWWRDRAKYDPTRASWTTWAQWPARQALRQFKVEYYRRGFVSVGDRPTRSLVRRVGAVTSLSSFENHDAAAFIDPRVLQPDAEVAITDERVKVRDTVHALSPTNRAICEGLMAGRPYRELIVRHAKNNPARYRGRLARLQVILGDERRAE